MLQADQILAGRNKTRMTYNNRVRELKALPPLVPVPGDRLVCLRNNREKGLLNGQLWIAKQVKRKGKGTLQMLLEPEDAGERKADVMVHSHEFFFNGREEELQHYERRRFDEFTFGYCLTVHKAQGSQWDNVYLFDESRVFRDDARKWTYTAITRAAEKITVVM